MQEGNCDRLVIDYPGVDDRDETIPELPELLLSLAQIVFHYPTRDLQGRQSL